MSGLLSDSNTSKMNFLHQSELVAPKRYTSTIRFRSITIPVVEHGEHHEIDSCESAIAFINPRMHACHTKFHDPINDHMTTNRSDSVICEFSAV